VRAKGSKIRKYVEKNQWAYAAFPLSISIRLILARHVADEGVSTSQVVRSTIANAGIEIIEIIETRTQLEVVHGGSIKRC